jgi:hypothetical protein
MQYNVILNHHGNGKHFLFLFFDEPFLILISSILIFSDVDIFLIIFWSFSDFDLRLLVLLNNSTKKNTGI